MKDRVPEVHLGLCDGDKDDVAPMRMPPRCVEQRRLADACFAAQDKRGAVAGPQRFHQRFEGRDLALAAEQLGVETPIRRRRVGAERGGGDHRPAA
jgi:hypothetical protein